MIINNLIPFPFLSFKIYIEERQMIFVDLSNTKIVNILQLIVILLQLICRYMINSSIILYLSILDRESIFYRLNIYSKSKTKLLCRKKILAIF